jgi:hypothetical protein
MVMTTKEKHELIERLTSLPLGEQLDIIESMIRALRKANVDREAVGQAMDAMVADPGMQRVLRNEDLVTPNAAG